MCLRCRTDCRCHSPTTYGGDTLLRTGGLRRDTHLRRLPARHRLPLSLQPQGLMYLPLARTARYYAILRGIQSLTEMNSADAVAGIVMSSGMPSARFLTVYLRCLSRYIIEKKKIISAESRPLIIYYCVGNNTGKEFTSCPFFSSFFWVVGV